MTDAPKRIYMDPELKFPECEKQYSCDVEYVRTDLYEEAVEMALEECPFREDTGAYKDWWHERKTRLLTMTTERG